MTEILAVALGLLGYALGVCRERERLRRAIDAADDWEDEGEERLAIELTYAGDKREPVVGAIEAEPPPDLKADLQRLAALRMRLLHCHALEEIRELETRLELPAEERIG